MSEILNFSGQEIYLHSVNLVDAYPIMKKRWFGEIAAIWLRLRDNGEQTGTLMWLAIVV
jgi:hypothetical protein